MRTLLALALATTLTASCATAPSSAPPVCPQLPAYSKETQARAAEDLKLLPADSPVHLMMADYGTMRGEVRVCRGAR